MPVRKHVYKARNSVVCPIKIGGYARFHYLTATEKCGRKSNVLGRAAPPFCSLFSIGQTSSQKSVCGRAMKLSN